jgi:hypothetical protein
MKTEDEMIEYAVRFLLSNEQDARHLVYDLVTGWPEARAQQVIYALAMSAGTVEHLLTDPDLSHTAGDVWRLSGLLGIDMWMMQSLDLPAETAADVLAYWRSHDPFFLDVGG